ncbi:MAG TPA: hypothetical protein PKA41_04730 [Verrucomicrobiota bacterium]|nr:hypothetical protein [Verrucomicrobiota bacterium]
MKWILRSLLILAVAGLGYWLWTVFFPPPEKLIRRQLISLARTASIDTKAGTIARAVAATEIPGFFTQDARIIVNIPPYPQQSLEGRDDISEAAKLLQARIRSIKVEFLDLNIVVGKEKRSAQVDLTAKITFPRDDDLIAQELKFLLKENDGKWLITRVMTVNAFN